MLRQLLPDAQVSVFESEANHLAIARPLVDGGVDWQLASMPADFLIGPDGTVLRVHYGRDIGDHMPIDEIEQALSGADAG